MKKTIAIILIILCLLSINTTLATEVNTLEQHNKNDVSEIKDKMEIKRNGDGIYRFSSLRTS